MLCLHKSFDYVENYERMEILGDAILEIYIVSNIYHLFEEPNSDNKEKLHSKKAENYNQNFNANFLTPKTMTNTKSFHNL